MPPREVFVSHSSLDRAISDRVVNVLRNNGIPVWYSRANIMGAQQWHDEIGNALRRCDWFIVLLSPDSVQATWVKRELQYALNHGQYENHIIPVKIIDCNSGDLSWTLENFQEVDLTGLNAAGYAALLGVWGLGFNGVM
jgi:hypothetical protein